MRAENADISFLISKNQRFHLPWRAVPGSAFKTGSSLITDKAYYSDH